MADKKIAGYIKKHPGGQPYPSFKMIITSSTAPTFDVTYATSDGTGTTTVTNNGDGTYTCYSNDPIDHLKLADTEDNANNITEIFVEYLADVVDATEMFYPGYSHELNAITSITFGEYCRSPKLENMHNMFYYINTQNTDAIIDFGGLDTSNVTDMSYMFRDGYGIKEIKNLKNLNTSNVTDMSEMFSGCTVLTSLDVSNFDTSNVTTMQSMFNSCRKLTSLDVSNFDTSNVTDMSGMFSSCYELESLDVSNFDTSNVTYMSSMFRFCYALETLDLSNFDTGSVTGMVYMFNNCTSITNIQMPSDMTTTKPAADMRSMFYGCSDLQCLNLLDTTNATDTSSMFDGCDNLTAPDSNDQSNLLNGASWTNPNSCP